MSKCVLKYILIPALTMKAKIIPNTDFLLKVFFKAAFKTVYALFLTISEKILLSRGKLTKACGLGGLFKHHSNELYALFKIVWIVNQNCGVNQGDLERALPSANCIYTMNKYSTKTKTKLAILFLSATVTKDTVNRTAIVTNKTSRMEI